MPCRKQGKSGTLPSIRIDKIAGGDIEVRSRGLLVQLGGGTIHGPCGRQLQLKGAEKE